MYRIPSLFVASLVLALSACSSHPSGTPVGYGRVTGILLMEGGVAPGTARTRIPGIIELSAHGHPIITMHVLARGTFRAQIQVGEYEVTATTPRIQQVNAGGNRVMEPCTTDQPPITVATGRTTGIQVTCIVP
jgi:hypothetical protein